jgi:hypothetical protein
MPYLTDAQIKLLKLEVEIERTLQEEGWQIMDPPLSDCPNCDDRGCPVCEEWYADE